MKKLLKLAALSIIATITYSCKEDFLDKQPSQFITTTQLAEAAAVDPGVIAGTMAGIYSLTFNTGTGGTQNHDDFGQKGYDIYSDMLCGDMALSQSVYGWYRADITEFVATQDFTRQRNYMPWRYYYRLINSAHTVIDGLGGETVTPALDENKWIMGQAKAIRAMSYFYLAQLYQKVYDASEPILPIYRTSLDQNGPKVTAAEIYDLIESDFNDALTLLGNFTRADKSQINRSVVQGYFAYALAARGKYAEAYTQANAALTSGGFTVTQGSELTAGFNDLASAAGWMWGIDQNTETGLGLVSFWGQVDYFSYSYAAVGDYKVMDATLYDAIPANDLRKAQFLNAPGSNLHGLPYYKFYDAGRVQFGASRPIQNDYVYMRVAEMHLMAAETAAMSGNEGAARGHLKDLVSLRVPDATYIDALSGQGLLDEIYLQTRIELWGEGKSYLAMKRNRATVTRGVNHLSNVGVAIAYNDERLTFEIPEAEIQNNPFISDQNN
ncbi:MAG: RagB/SusD family nutrient uptake outer membrane protein [Flavobacteriaceae bacterium]